MCISKQGAGLQVIWASSDDRTRCTNNLHLVTGAGEDMGDLSGFHSLLSKHHIRHRILVRRTPRKLPSYLRDAEIALREADFKPAFIRGFVPKFERYDDLVDAVRKVPGRSLSRPPSRPAALRVLRLGDSSLSAVFHHGAAQCLLQTNRTVDLHSPCDYGNSSLFLRITTPCEGQDREYSSNTG